MTPDKQRKLIRQQMTEAGLTAGSVIMSSGYTGLRYYLAGGDIKATNLEAVKKAIKRLIERKAEVKK